MKAGMEMHDDRGFADEPHSVAAVYENVAIAESYLDKRLNLAWQQLLHAKQVKAINRAVATSNPDSILEIAPGPARLTVEVTGVRSGTAIENSEAMIEIARTRLAARGLDKQWSVMRGDAFSLDSVLGNRTFDLAYTFRFIRHFRLPERKQLYGQICNHLSRGGLFVFDVVNETVRNAIDARSGKPVDEIAIYDALYNPESFGREMRECGFEVVELIPVISRFAIQSWISYRLSAHLPAATARVVSWLEKDQCSDPLEWVALCRRI